MINPDSMSEAVRQALKDLQAQLARQESVIDAKTGEVARLEFVVKLQKEQIRLLTLRLFGSKGEKLSPNQVQLLLEEASVSLGEVAKEAELPESKKSDLPPKAKRPRSSHIG